MKATCVAGLLLFSTIAVAQNPDLENAEPGFSPTAGGASTLSDGETKATDLTVSRIETDVTLRTALGPFSVTRKYTSGKGWNSLDSLGRPHGDPIDYQFEGMWFSSVGAYARFNYSRPFYRGANQSMAESFIQIRGPDGDLTTSRDIGELYGPKVIPVQSGPNRIHWLDTESPDGVDRPVTIQLIVPGVARYEFEFANRTASGSYTEYSAWYRLKRVFNDGGSWLKTAVCEFNYATHDTRFSSIDCVGGFSIVPTWNAANTRLLSLSVTRPGVSRLAVTYGYDNGGAGKLTTVVGGGRTLNYTYNSVQRIFNVDSASDARTLAAHVREGGQLLCGGSPWAPPSVSFSASPNAAWATSQAQTCSPSQQTTEFFSVNGAVSLTRVFTSDFSSGLTKGISRTCTKSGGPCPDIANTSENWAISMEGYLPELQEWVALPSPVDTSSQGRRGAFTVTASSLDYEYWGGDFNNPILNTQVNSIAEGATNSAGASPLLSTQYTWQYFTAKDTRQQLPDTESSPSSLASGSQTTKKFVYDLASRRLKAVFRSGFTRDISGALTARTVGTFYFTNRPCTGVTTSDPYARTQEVHGPCEVASTASTDCDVSPGAYDQIPVSQFEYYPTSDTTFGRAGRLKSKAIFATTTFSGSGPSCFVGNALTTTYDTYDVDGNVTREVSPSGVVTTRTFDPEGRLTNENVNGLNTVLLYAAAQGGRLSAKQFPSGDWEVYCYRIGASAADCTGGTSSENLQWKARISGHAPSGNWNILSKTEYTYSPRPNSLGTGGALSGEKRTKGSSVRRQVFELDALERIISASPANATGALWDSPSAYDANDNVIGTAPGFALAPANCGGLVAGVPDEASSQLCERRRYDRLDRVTRINSANDLAVHQFGYDARGNLNSVTGPRGALATYEVDDFGGVVSISGAWATGTTRQTYSGSGRLLARRTPSMGATSVSYSYDAAGRPTKASIPSAVLWEKSYDGNSASWANCPWGSLNKGKLWFKDDSFGRTFYQYDALGNLVRAKRVRAGSASACSASDSSSHDNPDTVYVYDSLARLSEMKYPHGMKVKYTWGSSGRGDEVTAIQYDAVDGVGWRNLISSITYDIGGEVASYAMNTPVGGTVDVNYYRNGPHYGAPPQNCNFNSSGWNDWSGRLTGMTVKRGTTNLLTKRYSWDRELMTQEDTCWMNASSPVVDAYTSYDKLGQLLVSSRSDSWGGAFRSSQLQYAFGTDRVREATNLGAGIFWEHSYDAKGREIAQLPRNSMTGSVVSSWEQRGFGYDVDGRVVTMRDTPAPVGPLTVYGKSIDLTPNNGFGSVYSQMVINGGTYQYFYDSEGRRRLKIYPSGFSDEFFYDGEHLLEDQGLRNSSGFNNGLTFDQYVWLGNMPIAVLRQKFSQFYVRDAASADCMRNGEARNCGLFFVVNDYLPKPVAMVTASGFVAGIGEYDLFGRVNTVSVRAQANAPVTSGTWPFGPYTVANNATIASYTPPARGGMAGRARFNYALVLAANASSPINKTWIASGASCSTAVSPNYTGAIAAFATPWASYSSATQYCLKWDAPVVYGAYAGVVASSYEYQNAESGVTPTWLPLRFPGQYADAESGLFENWNRYYDPQVGRFVASDPALETFGADEVPENPYVYAQNSPLLRHDSTGLQSAVADSRAERQIKTREELGNRCVKGDEGACKDLDAFEDALAAQAATAVVVTAGVVAAETGAVAATGEGLALAGRGAMQLLRRAAGRVVGFIGVAAKWIRDNVSFQGPSPGLAYMNGRIVGITLRRFDYNVRLDLHPIKGSGPDPVLHINFGPSRSSEGAHIPLWRFKRK